MYTTVLSTQDAFKIASGVATRAGVDAKYA